MKDEAREWYWEVASISEADSAPGDGPDALLDHTTEEVGDLDLEGSSRAVRHLV